MPKKKRSKILISLCFWVFMINFLIENYIYYFQSREFVILFQVAINLIFILYALSQIVDLKIPKLARYVIFIVSFLIILGLLSTSKITTFNMLLKFILPLFFIIIGYNLLKNQNLILYFINKLWLLQIIFIAGILYSNIFSVGETFYDGGIKVGYLSVNSLYTVTFSWIILLFFINESRISRIISMVILAATFIIIVLILKRTLILLCILAMLFYIIQNMSLKRTISTSIIFLVGLAIFQLFFVQYFEQSLEARSSRFSEDYNVEEEGRFRENILPLIHMEGRPLMYLFGTGEVFNDRPYHYRYLNSDRELHNSFARIFWNGGIVLLLVFLKFYYSQLKLFFKARNKFKKNKLLSRWFYFGMIFVFLRFVSEFSSGITYTSYNLLSYLIIGGLAYISLNTKIKSTQ